MSHQCAWADAIVIRAVADALNLTIRVIESNPGFASVSNISPVSSETGTTFIYIKTCKILHGSGVAKRTSLNWKEYFQL